MNNLINYKYTDTPDGQDIFMKALVTSKYVGAAGAIMGTFDILMFSKPKGAAATFGRFAWFVGPMVGMASAFTITSNMARNFRNKDDKFNYFLGGAVTGSIMSAWLRTPVIAFPAAAILGFIGIVSKTAMQENWIILPELNQATKTATSVRNDWTLAKDPEHLKGWTNGN